LWKLLEITYDTYVIVDATKWLTEVTSHTLLAPPVHTIDSFSRASIFHLFCEVKIIAEPFPGNDLLDGKTWVAVGQWQEIVPSTDDNRHNHAGCSP